jgi:four helix bundle protein
MSVEEKRQFKEDFHKRVYLFALHTIKYIDGLSGGQSSNILSKQLLRSATSIGANIVEAQASASKKEYVNFFSIALKSANETKFWLGLLRDSKKANAEETNKLLAEAKEIANIIGASVITLKENIKNKR